MTRAAVVRKGNHAASVTARPMRELVFDPHRHAMYCCCTRISEMRLFASFGYSGEAGGRAERNEDGAHAWTADRHGNGRRRGQGGV